MSDGQLTSLPSIPFLTLEERAEFDALVDKLPHRAMTELVTAYCHAVVLHHDFDSEPAKDIGAAIAHNLLDAMRAMHAIATPTTEAKKNDGQ